MNDATLELILASQSVAPGSTLSGEVRVFADLTWWAKSMQVSLSWKASGKGLEDQAVVAVQDLVGPQGQELSGNARIPFQLEVPPMPWTYNGRNIHIDWMVSLAAEGNDGEEAIAEQAVVVHPRPEESGLTPACG